LTNEQRCVILLEIGKEDYMVSEIWVYVALVLGLGIGFVGGIWLTLVFLGMIPDFEVDEKDIP